MCSACDDEYDTEDDWYSDYDDGEESLGGRSALVDVDRLRTELSYITTHPERWYQGDWVRALTDEDKFGPQPPTACGTQGCLAGNAVVHADGELHWERGEWYDYETGKYKLYWKTEFVTMPGDEEKSHIENAARDLFGLNSEQADYLFAAENSLDDLWRLAGIISDGKITPEDRAKAEAERERLKAATAEAHASE